MVAKFMPDKQPVKHPNSDYILHLAQRISELPTDDVYLGAVQALVRYVEEIYRGIGQVSAAENGLAAETLLRTLFEVITNTIILAKHRNKLQDFIGHGRLTELRMMRVIEEPVLKAKLASEVAASEDEYQRLWAEFKEQPWHRMSTKDSFVEAEFQRDIYDRYYRRASSIAHGQPYQVVRKGKVEARPDAWKKLSVGASNMSAMLMMLLFGILNREFRLGLEGEINELTAEVDSHLQQHMDAIRKL